VKPTTSLNQTSLEVDHELQKAMYVGIQQLGMLRRFHHDPRESRRIRTDITAVAHWIEFLVSQRELIAFEITDPTPDLVKLEGRVVCEKCRKNARYTSAETNDHEDSAPPPIWEKQLGFLLSCTKTVGFDLFEQDCVSCNLREFPDCLVKLVSASLRLQRFLSSRGVGEMDIAVEHSFSSCSQCGQLISPPPAAVL
jgi:hypothetical protein